MKEETKKKIYAVSDKMDEVSERFWPQVILGAIGGLLTAGAAWVAGRNTEIRRRAKSIAETAESAEKNNVDGKLINLKEIKKEETEE